MHEKERTAFSCTLQKPFHRPTLNTCKDNAPNWAHHHLQAVQSLEKWKYFCRTTCSVDATLIKRPAEIALVFRTMTPRRVEEFKVESEKLKVMERLSRNLHNFTLYTRPSPRGMRVL